MKRSALVLLVSLIAACGSPGRVVLELTDAPPDTDAMSRVMVTLLAVQAQVAQQDADAAWQDVPLAQHEFDLLALQNDVTAALGELDLPKNAQLTQLRMKLNPDGRNEAIMRDGRVCRLDLQDVNPAGFEINQPFQPLQPQEGALIRAVIDFDVQESIQKDRHQAQAHHHGRLNHTSSHGGTTFPAPGLSTRRTAP